MQIIRGMTFVPAVATVVLSLLAGDYWSALAFTGLALATIAPDPAHRELAHAMVFPELPLLDRAVIVAVLLSPARIESPRLHRGGR